MKKKLLGIILTVALALLCACCISACVNVDTVPSNGDCDHADSVHIILLQPTCTKQGYECYECRDCKVRYGYAYVDKGEHDFYYDSTVVTPDCTHEGVIVYKCKNCGEIDTENINSFGGHSYPSYYLDGAEPTCTSDGYRYRKCNNCDEVEYEKIDALGHDWDSGTVVFAPDCTHNGMKQYTCANCEETKNEIIEPTGQHSYSDTVAVSVNPTCTTEGYGYTECTECGDRQYQTFNAIGHDWDEGTVAFAADCIHNGLLRITCANCEEVRSEILYATGEHDYVNGICKYCRLDFAEVTDRLYNGSYGYEYFRTLQNSAGFCGLYDAIDESTKIFHHSETLNATETEDGYEFFTVNYSDIGLTADEAIAVYKTYLDDKPLYYWLGKSLTVYGNNIILYADEKYATATARKEYNQSLYEKLTAYKEIAAGESAYTVALAYHDEIIKSIDYAYKSNGKPEDEAWAHNITGVFDGVGAVCEGYARSFQLLLNMRGIKNILVTGFGGEAAHAWNLVRLGDGQWYWYDLTYDDTPHNYWGVSHYYAFETDENFLENHTVGSSDDFGVNFMPILPDRATAGYKGKEVLYGTEFTVGGLTYTIDGYDSVYLNHIGVGGDLVEIPEHVSYLGHDYTVVGLLKKIQYGTDNIFPIYSEKLTVKSVTVPKSVVYIDDNAFAVFESVGLENIYVDEDNPKFRSLDGVLFTKNLYSLVAYPVSNPRTSYAIPDETVWIANSAFKGSYTGLKSLHIGKSLDATGAVCWGGQYPEIDSKVFYGRVSGKWNTVFKSLAEGAVVTIDEENTGFSIRDGLLCSYDGRILYAPLPTTEHVVIGKYVERVDSNAFNTVETIKSVEFLTLPKGDLTFIQCYSLESVTLPEGLTSIYRDMFFNCHVLKEIEIPSTVTAIGKSAFYSCRLLTSVIIPAGVQKIDACAFAGCIALKEIVLEEGNTAYKLVNNCLIEIATGVLICAYGDFTIPTDGSVTCIADDAVIDRSKITQLIIPDGVTEIGKYVLFNCSKLETLVIPTSLTIIGQAGVSDRTTVFYKGTETQWDEIDIEGYCQGIIYFYSEEKPTASGNYWHYVDGEIVIW